MLYLYTPRKVVWCILNAEERRFKGLNLIALENDSVDVLLINWKIWLLIFSRYGVITLRITV